MQKKVVIYIAIRSSHLHRHSPSWKRTFQIIVFVTKSVIFDKHFLILNAKFTIHQIILRIEVPSIAKNV